MPWPFSASCVTVHSYSATWWNCSQQGQWSLSICALISDGPFDLIMSTFSFKAKKILNFLKLRQNPL